MAWTKLTPATGSAGTGRTPRTKFAISGNSAGKGYLVVPRDYATTIAVDIHRDGSKLAFHFHNGGAFRVTSKSKKSKARKVYIPKAAADLVPIGFYDIDDVPENGVLVVDLANLVKPAVKPLDDLRRLHLDG